MSEQNATPKSQAFTIIDCEQPTDWPSVAILKASLLSRLERLGKIEGHLHLGHFSRLRKDETEILSHQSARKILIIDDRISPKLFSDLKHFEVWVYLWGKVLPRLQGFAQIDLLGQLGLVVSAEFQLELLTRLLGPSPRIRRLPHLPVAAPRCQATIENVQRKDRIFLYAGRISQSKNVSALVDLFVRASEQGPLGTLLIAGSPDNINTFSSPPAYLLGYEAERFFTALEEARNKGVPVTYLGHLPAKELDQLYNVADTYVSLSTAEEEDFGLSVWEALTRGLSCVVSNWGGYRDFRSIDGVTTVPISHQEGTLWIDEQQFRQCLQQSPRPRNQVRESLEHWAREREALITDFDLPDLDPPMTSLPSNLLTTKGFYFNDHTDAVSAYWD